MGSHTAMPCQKSKRATAAFLGASGTQERFQNALFLSFDITTASSLKLCLKVSDMRNNRGCGRPVVKVSDHGRHVMSSSPVPLRTRRVGQRCTLNLSRAETSSHWCGS
ncbi:uncharacterized protein TNCV_5077481 [Trichonephila clavipes]|uniref:Uncharacterized protein n=1 Tax=Trichonephila clavipes TaxID=2585209 RepID=A0A8X6S3D5_TRICX|nr:uncharacterized protein TNCV_5077481 [Trichonephila clavipes]